MTTRLYLRHTATTPPITPTPDAGWNVTTGFIRSLCDTHKTADTITTESTSGNGSAAANICMHQWVSAPLTVGQTITGAQALSGQVRASETSANNNLFVVLGIRIVASDGSTVRKTVFAVTQDNTEVGTALTNRNLAATSAAGNYTTVDGDRIVIELGLGGDPASSNTHDGSLSIGDSAASDLAVDDTTTTANNPWIQFNDTLTFVRISEVTSSAAISTTVTLDVTTTAALSKTASSDVTTTASISIITPPLVRMRAMGIRSRPTEFGRTGVEII